MAKAKAAGSFIGGIFNNPGVVILGGLAIALLIFNKPITQAFADLGKSISSGIGGINIELPEFPEFKFPEFKFPEFKFPDITFPDITFPSFDFGNIFGQGTEIDIALSEGATPSDIADIIGIDPNDPNQDPTKFLPPIPEEGDPLFVGPVQPTPPFMLPDTPPISVPFTPPVELPPGFLGGGVSFEGGTIFETPIENLSLSQIIDKFMVTASQAADILAQAQDNFGDFDFGTNTGSGFGPGDDPLTTPLVTGGATLESEAEKAAQLFQELFGNVQNPNF